MRKNGLTLLEIIISMVILALVITGLVNVFVASKRLIQHSRYRTEGGAIGKKFIDPLQAYIRQDTWGGSNCFNTNDPNNPASMANCPAIPASYTMDNTIYTPQYYISNLSSDLKKVKAKIAWNESAS